MIDRKFWSEWARTLQRNNLTGFALTLLEGAGPIKLVFSQILFGVSPLVNQLDSVSWQTFAQMLEDQNESKSFADFLREETQN